MKKFEASTELTLEEIVLKDECERDHLFFTRYFFKKRQNSKFLVNWHHHWISDALNDVAQGKIKNLVINIPPGGTKTELVVINFIARSLALNPYCRFLHLSYSDDLALLNSKTARDLIQMDEYQRFWPVKISNDSSSTKRWNIKRDDKEAGGVYAAALGGSITGFRAGHMREGFNGALIIDDPSKADSSFSKSQIALANRQFMTTVKSRKANPDVPVIVIMQRLAENDLSGFIKSGNVPGEWHSIVIPAVLDAESLQKIPEKYRKMIPSDSGDRFSYWPYKENLDEMLAMERGDGVDQTGGRVSRYVFASQYQQNPVAVGGNIIKGKDFVRYKILPELTHRVIYADTAQKTAERNDWSVFQVWGLSSNGKIYLIDQIRGKWESPELRKRAKAFWVKHKLTEATHVGQLRKMKIEDKSSGTDLIQSLKTVDGIPIEGIQRSKDKFTRVMDGLPYIEAGLVCIPEEAEWVSDFLTECEAFSSGMEHKHDDQIDPMLDAIQDLLSRDNKMRVWEKLGKPDLS